MNQIDDIKVGDLIKMKYAMFWHLKQNPRIHYTEDVGTVVHVSSHIVELIWPTGDLVRMDKDFFEVIS